MRESFRIYGFNKIFLSGLRLVMESLPDLRRKESVKISLIE